MWYHLMRIVDTENKPTTTSSSIQLFPLSYYNFVLLQLCPGTASKHWLWAFDCVQEWNSHSFGRHISEGIKLDWIYHLVHSHRVDKSEFRHENVWVSLSSWGSYCRWITYIIVFFISSFLVIPLSSTVLEFNPSSWVLSTGISGRCLSI